jgi:hypothetical protein
MSADGSFIALWARRKRGAARTARGQAKPKNSPDGAVSQAATASRPPEEPQSIFDPASLPPIESINASSDIRPFLAAGVPADLTRAALRRVWSADHEIRDFVGLSENSWDFNALGTVPGFGSLTAEDARRLLARVMEETEALGPGHPAAKRLKGDKAPVPVSESQQTTTGSVPDQMKLGQDTGADYEDPVPADIAVQHEREQREPSRPVLRRRHGSALPD